MRLLDYYKTALKALGSQRWWPAETPFEVMVGAILTQNTNWSNVEKAISNLKKSGLLDPQKLMEAETRAVAELIRPAGYFNIKAGRLMSFLRWFGERYRFSLQEMSKQSVESLREELLSINGIGRETADSIILYALGKPSFVVDAYTYRIFARHNLIEETVEYDDLKQLVESELPKDPAIYNEFHALLVNIGKNYCKKSEPLCEKCPLKKFLP